MIMSPLLRIRTIILIAIIALTASSAAAQQPAPGNNDKIVAQLKPYKHDFLIKHLDLSKEQQRTFLPLYDKMDEELLKINEETRRLERNVSENKDASETEIEAASRAVFEQKIKEGEVELSYYEKFKDVLTARQLLMLKSTERRFTQWIARHHRRMNREKADADNRR